MTMRDDIIVRIIAHAVRQADGVDIDAYARAIFNELRARGYEIRECEKAVVIPFLGRVR